jgi:hypothetical protein
MTRMEAEMDALKKGQADRQNNYVAANNGDGTWRVDSFPVHRHMRKSGD